MNKCIVLIGPPCSGKSTIGKKLADSIKYRYVSSGDIARKMAENDGTVDSLNAGNMAPEDKMREEISTIFSAGGNLILDGFPRFVEQYEWMMDRFFDYQFTFILIDVPTLSLFTRVASRGRADDTAFMERLEYYMKNTVPMISRINEDDDIHGGVVYMTNRVIQFTINEIKEYLYGCRWI